VSAGWTLPRARPGDGMKAAELAALPVEIVEMIVERVATVRELVALSKTCSLARTIADARFPEWLRCQEDGMEGQSYREREYDYVAERIHGNVLHGG
jgi:hypothetical protein